VRCKHRNEERRVWNSRRGPGDGAECCGRVCVAWRQARRMRFGMPNADRASSLAALHPHLADLASTCRNLSSWPHGTHTLSSGIHTSHDPRPRRMHTSQHPRVATPRHRSHPPACTLRRTSQAPCRRPRHTPRSLPKGRPPSRHAVCHAAAARLPPTCFSRGRIDGQLDPVSLK